MTKSNRRMPVPLDVSSRPPQTARGGYIIVCRNSTNGILIRIADRPYEHADQADAEAQAQRMADRYRKEFAVFREVASVLPPPAEVVTTAPVADPEPSPPPAVQEPAPRPAVVVERRTRRRLATGGRQ
ncbi:hypothetical protein FV226_24615 [Methylobacterium sp. WL12]|uniref:hypothetical protein n=1 Tax=Methylobacterium sp. WL12 TaxID=2603890 RepID=UPI0011CA28AB|nr:hypothetical protein [Methylobacterium sp. WL12]TXM65678.1 hypothetical protein FV226_24615 [Methylobacterium sp. WL12]